MPQLYIMCGFPFAGKSTLSKRIAEVKGFTRIDLDEVKVEVVGNVKEEDITQAQWDEIYKHMYAQIESALINGKTVIQDAGNFTRYERGLVKAIADKLDLESTTIFVDTPLEVARNRWMGNKVSKERFDINQASFDGAVSEMEIPDEQEKHLVYHEGEPIDLWISKYL